MSETQVLEQKIDTLEKTLEKIVIKLDHIDACIGEEHDKIIRAEEREKGVVRDMEKLRYDLNHMGRDFRTEINDNKGNIERIKNNQWKERFILLTLSMGGGAGIGKLLDLII